VISCVIVDDSPSFPCIARTLLERDGFTVAGVAKTSAQAIAQVEALQPDVVLVDVFLGEESGVDSRGASTRSPAVRCRSSSSRASREGTGRT
jgi:response regulator of citrate/malate metabolism